MGRQHGWRRWGGYGGGIRRSWQDPEVAVTELNVDGVAIMAEFGVDGVAVVTVEFGVVAWSSPPST